MPGHLEIALLAVLSLAFIVWLLVLVDCLRNEPAEGNDRIVWTLVLVFTSLLGIVLYLAIRRPQRVRLHGR